MYIYLLNNRNINNQLGLGRDTEKINHWPVKKTWSSLHRQLRESRLTLHWTAPCLPYCPLEEPRRSEKCTRRWWRPQRPGTSLGPQTETEWTRTRCWSDWDSTAWPSGWAEENKETNESKLLNKLSVVYDFILRPDQDVGQWTEEAENRDWSEISEQQAGQQEEQWHQRAYWSGDSSPWQTVRHQTGGDDQVEGARHQQLHHLREKRKNVSKRQKEKQQEGEQQFLCLFLLCEIKDFLTFSFSFFFSLLQIFSHK